MSFLYIRGGISILKSSENDENGSGAGNGSAI